MNTQLEITRSTAKPHQPRMSLPSLARHIAATWRQRQSLRRLEENALTDIGLTRSMADVEASRPLWDVPGNWLR